MEIKDHIMMKHECIAKISCCFDKCVSVVSYPNCMTIASLGVQRMYKVPRGYYGGVWCICKGYSTMTF